MQALRWRRLRPLTGLEGLNQASGESWADPNCTLTISGNSGGTTQGWNFPGLGGGGGGGTAVHRCTWLWLLWKRSMPPDPSCSCRTV